MVKVITRTLPKFQFLKKSWDNPNHSRGGQDNPRMFKQFSRGASRGKLQYAVYFGTRRLLWVEFETLFKIIYSQMPINDWSPMIQFDAKLPCR